MRPSRVGVLLACLGALLATSGCSLPYGWGVPLTLPPGAAGAIVATDCLDLRVEPAVPDGSGAVRLTYDMGNRCDRPVRVDLGVARVENGDDAMPLGARDRPPGVAAPSGVLDVLAHASVTLAYRAPEGASVRSVCVDLRDGAGRDGAADVLRAHATDPPPPVIDIATSWDRDVVPPIFVEVGGGRQPLTLQGRTIHDGAIGTFSTDALGTPGSYGGNYRVGGRFYGPFYAGGQLQVGGGNVAGRQLQASPSVTLSGGFLDASARGFVGVYSPRLGPIRAHAEGVVGARILDFSIEERLGCTHDGCASLQRADLLLGGRAGLDVFVTPWVSLGGWVTIDTRDPSPGFGFAMTWHGQGYDGRR